MGRTRKADARGEDTSEDQVLPLEKERSETRQKCLKRETKVKNNEDNVFYNPFPCNKRICA